MEEKKFESKNETVSLAWNIIKKQFVIILILIGLLFASNIAWLIVYVQYDYGVVDNDENIISQEAAGDSYNIATAENIGGDNFGSTSDDKVQAYKESDKDTEEEGLSE